METNGFALTQLQLTNFLKFVVKEYEKKFTGDTRLYIYEIRKLYNGKTTHNLNRG